MKKFYKWWQEVVHGNYMSNESFDKAKERVINRPCITKIHNGKVLVYVKNYNKRFDYPINYKPIK